MSPSRKGIILAALQLAIVVSLAAKYHDPLAVGIGSVLALPVS